MRIPESEHAVAGDLDDAGIRAADPLLQHGHGLEDRLRIQRDAACIGLELIGEHVQQDLGVRVGVDVAPVQAEHLVLQHRGVGQVAVVCEREPERRVDVERLRLLAVRRRTGRRIADVRDAGESGQGPHVAGPEDVADQAVALLHRERPAGARCDAGRVLAPVLQQQQPVIEHLVDR